MITRRRIVIALGAAALASPLSPLAQPQTKVWRIGYLASTDPTKSPRTEAFRAGLRERGYAEGKNIAIEFRWTEGAAERLPEFAAELVRAKVDVIFAWGTPAVAAAKQATASIPIVFAGVGDPVGSGFAASLARGRTNTPRAAGCWPTA